MTMCGSKGTPNVKGPLETRGLFLVKMELTEMFVHKTQLHVPTNNNIMDISIMHYP